MIIKLDDRLNEKYVDTFLKDILTRNSYTSAFDMTKNDADFIFIRDSFLDKYDELLIIDNIIDKDDNKCNNNKLIVSEEDINIVKISDKEAFFNYKGFFFLHLRANNPQKYIKSICITIEIIIALEDRGFNINEKEIYRSIYNLLSNDN